MVEDGYEFFNNRSLVTLFSAPNYCGQFDNAGAIMMVKEDLTCSFSILPVSQAFFVHRSFSPSAFLYKKTLRPKKEKKLKVEPEQL